MSELEFELESRRAPLDMSAEEFAEIGHNLVDDVADPAAGEEVSGGRERVEQLVQGESKVLVDDIEAVRSDDEVDISGNVEFRGSVIANSISYSGSGHVAFDEALYDKNWRIGPAHVIAWREVD